MDENVDTLSPASEVIRVDNVDDGMVKTLVQKLYGLKVINITQLPSYYDNNHHVTVENTCDNNHVPSTSPDGYVLKILNSEDSKDTDFVDGQNQLILHVCKHGIKTPRPVPNIHGKLNSLERLNDKTEDIHIVRLFEYLPGRVLKGAPYTADLLFEIGKLAGKLDKAGQDFFHPGFEKRKVIWNMTEFPKTVKYLGVITDQGQRQLLEDVLDTFNRDVVPYYSKLKQGMIHSDFNEENILIRQLENKDRPYEVIGIIDFGDCALTYYVFEAAILLAHIMLKSTVLDPFESGGHALAGYLSEFSLEHQDLQILKECIAARFAQLLIIGAHTAKVDPDNSEYVLHFAERGWPLFDSLWKKSKKELYKIFNDCASGYGMEHIFQFEPEMY